MKDIRNFFGGGGGVSAKKVEEPPKVEKTKAKTFSQKNDEDEDFLIESSDEEWKSDAKPERKRLKGKNTVIKSPVASARMTTTESIESTSVKEVRNLLPTVIDLDDETMTTSVPTSPVAALRSPVKAEVASPNKIVLQVMKSGVKTGDSSNSATASGDKKRKEVDPNAYFGLPPSTPTKSAARSPPAKKVKAEPTSDNDEGTTVKSPAGKRGAKAAAAKDNGGWLVNELKFVITGVLNSGSREDVESLILSAGGKIAKAVSGKTDYLVTGVLLEDGRPVSEGSKYRTAVEKGVKVVNEEELMSMLAADAEKKSKTPASAAAVKIESKGAFGFDNKSSSSSSSSSSGNGVGSKSQNDENDLLWVDKHKPKTSAELIGSAELVRKMSEWLKRWEEVHIKKTHKVPFSKENPGARAVLLSGPPGIGKTTVATLIAKEFGYDLLEMNASDTRNKKEIGDQLTDAVMSKAIGSMSFLGSASCLKKRLIIMDEVDGMGGSDRGGVAELIKIIKTSKTPIVCICNDRQSTKIKSLANHCFDLRVKRPTKQQIATRLVQIAAKEGMQMDQNAGEILVEQVGNDIRQALNTMQMWRASKSTMQYSDVKNAMTRIEKDKVLRQTPFDACLQILGGNKAPLDERYNSFFIDYSLLPLMIQQNYIDSAKNGIFKQPTLDEAARMDVLSRASDAVSDIDMIGSRIMGQDQHWELLPAQAAFCCSVGSVVQGFQPFPSFPAWLGKNSSQNKMSRLTKEIVHHSSLSIGQGFCPIRMDYVPYVRETLLSLLLQQNNSTTTSDSEGGGSGDAISQVIDMLDAYGLSKEDFMETLKEMQFIVDGDKQFKDKYDVIETKVKTALTKAYNNSAHRSQILVSEIASKGKKGRGGGGGAARGVAFDEDGNMIEDESAMAEEEEQVEEDEDDNIDAFIAKSKKAKAVDKATKAAAKSTAGSSSKSKK